MGTNLIGPDLKREAPTATLLSTLVNSQMGFETDLQQRMVFKSPTNGAVYFNPQGAILAVYPSVGIQTATPDADLQVAGSIHCTVFQFDHTLTGLSGSSISTDSLSTTYEVDIGGKLNLGVTDKDYSGSPSSVNLDFSAELTSVFNVLGSKNDNSTVVTIINGNPGDYCEIYNTSAYQIQLTNGTWNIYLGTGLGTSTRNIAGTWCKFTV